VVIYAVQNTLSCSGAGACSDVVCIGAACSVDCTSDACTNGVDCDALRCDLDSALEIPD
jgi:hypothetical protein